MHSSILLTCPEQGILLSIVFAFFYLLRRHLIKITVGGLQLLTEYCEECGNNIVLADFKPSSPSITVTASTPGSSCATSEGASTEMKTGTFGPAATAASTLTNTWPTDPKKAADALHSAKPELEKLRVKQETDCCGVSSVCPGRADQQHFCVLCKQNCCVICKKRNASGDPDPE